MKPSRYTDLIVDLIIKELENPVFIESTEWSDLTVWHLEKFLDKIPKNKRKAVIESLQQGETFEKVSFKHEKQPLEQIAKLLELTDFHDSVIASLKNKGLFEKLIKKDKDLKTFLSHIPQDKHSKIINLLEVFIKVLLGNTLIIKTTRMTKISDFKEAILEELIKPEKFEEYKKYVLKDINDPTKNTQHEVVYTEAMLVIA